MIHSGRPVSPMAHTYNCNDGYEHWSYADGKVQIGVGSSQTLQRPLSAAEIDSAVFEFLHKERYAGYPDDGSWQKTEKNESIVTYAYVGTMDGLKGVPPEIVIFGDEELRISAKDGSGKTWSLKTMHYDGDVRKLLRKANIPLGKHGLLREIREKEIESGKRKQAEERHEYMRKKAAHEARIQECAHEPALKALAKQIAATINKYSTADHKNEESRQFRLEAKNRAINVLTEALNMELVGHKTGLFFLAPPRK